MIGLLRRQVRLIIITVIVGVGITTLVVFSMTPIYEATALVVVDASGRNLLDPNGDFNSSEIGSSRVASELEIMRSDAILLRVIERQALLSDPEFGVRLSLIDRALAFVQFAQPSLPSGAVALRRVLQGFKGVATASQVGLSDVIAMSARSQDRDRAAEIANAWADVYIEAQVSAKIDSTLKARDVIQARLGEARAALVAAEGSLDGYIDSNLSRIVGETGRADIASIATNLTDLTAQADELAARAERARAGLQQQNWQLMTESLQSAALRELERQRSELATSLQTASAAADFDLRAELEEIEQRLASLGEEEVASLGRTVADNENRKTDLRQRLRSAVLGSSLPPDMLGDIFELQQSAELGRQQYQTLLSRARELDAQATLQVADSRVVSPAVSPERAAFPSTTISLVGALIISLAAGAGLAYLRENLIGGLLTEDQAEDVLNIRIAAAVPRIRGAEPGEGSMADLMNTSPLSPFPESVRRIRVTIDQALRRMGHLRGQGQANGVVVMVTSSTVDEGKSTLALSMARAYAASRVRVCLIDCDLRRPSIHAMLGREPSSGLTDFLLETKPARLDERFLGRDPLSDAIVVSGGQRFDLPTDQLIGSANFGIMLAQLKSAFDIVIMDTPPIGPVADSLYLANHADLVMFVIMAGKTSQTEARLALTSLANAAPAEAPIVGVLNGQEIASAQYKGSYGGYYLRD